MTDDDIEDRSISRTAYRDLDRGIPCRCGRAGWYLLGSNRAQCRECFSKESGSHE